MKQEMANATPTEGGEVSRPTLLTRFVPVYRRLGLLLTAALVLIVLSAFTSAPHAHASSGGCWSYNTWSSNATSQESTDPILYGNHDGGPKLGLGLNTCGQYILIKWSRTVCFEGCPDLYYQVDWTRPGVNGWQQFTVNDQSNSASYMYSYFKNAHLGTYYNFAVKRCFSNGCSNWSPTVGITT
jgi:hypothetical protein